MQTAQIATTTVEVFLETLSLLSAWVEDGRQFTCFDVTKELRNKGHSVQHESTRRTVHGLHGLELEPFSSSNYVRSTTNFTTSTGLFDTAEVYHSKFDLGSYDPDQTDSLGDAPSVNQNPFLSLAIHQQGPKFCSPKAALVAPTVFVKHLNVGVDNRGRVCVRNDLTEAVGLKPGDMVRVHAFVNKIMLEKETSSSSQVSDNRLKVDRDGNIRVSRYLQKSAGLHYSTFNMTASGDKIEITV